MANSGILWIDTIYNWSVLALVECAKLLGFTYEEINVWLFCVAWPIATLAMIAAIVMLWRSNRRMHEQIAKVA
jgi:hypothetical protein